MKRMLPKPLRPYAPAIGLTIAGVVLSTSLMYPRLMMIVGAIMACIISITVTIEYLILVPLRKNPGAKRLIFLLGAVDALLAVSIARYFFDNYPFRMELLTVLFWALFFALLYLGWHIWMDQLEGARAYRRSRNHPEKREIG